MDQREENLLFSSMSDEDLATLPVKKILGLSEEDISTLNFIFWLVFFVERKLSVIVFDSVKTNVSVPKESQETYNRFFEATAEEMTFGGLINIFEKTMKPMSNWDLKLLTPYLRELNGLRNQVAHGRIKSLLYRGKDIYQRATKELMWKDLMEALESAVKIR